MECDVCYLQYNEERRPKILSCGHTLCSICLLTIMRDRFLALKCPTCRENFGYCFDNHHILTIFDYLRRTEKFE